MGLFDRFKNAGAQAAAAVVIQNLLTNYKQINPLFDADISASGNLFVQDVWDLKPDIYEGKFGQRPHKLAIVASALACALTRIPRSSKNRNGPLWALTQVLEEYEVNGRLYPYSSMDHQLFEEAKQVLEEELRSRFEE